MSEIKFFICCLCLTAIGSSWLPNGNMLRPKNVQGMNVLSSIKRDQFGKATHQPKGIIPIAMAELWVRETTGKNDGKRVEEYLATVHLKKGDPYCAAFVSWVFQQAGYDLPRTGWSPSLFPTSRLITAATPGNVFGIYFPAMKRIAHCGLIISSRSEWVSTIEANTDASGGRDGGGVYQRLRHKKSIRYISDWQNRSIK
jgi:hypothetical protein